MIPNFNLIKNGRAPFMSPCMTLLVLRGKNTLSVTQSKLFCLLSEKGSALKGKNLLPLGANSSFCGRPFFRKGLVCKKANRKSHKTVSLVKRQKIYQYIQSPYSKNMHPVSILRKSISGRHRAVRVADGPMTARCRFT